MFKRSYYVQKIIYLFIYSFIHSFFVFACQEAATYSYLLCELFSDIYLCKGRKLCFSL